MQFFLIGVLTLILMFYVGMLCALMFGYTKLYRESGNRKLIRDDRELPTVSIIVAARNEEHNLPQLIRSLTSQKYPKEKIEICIVDDNSTDSTWDILSRAQVENPNLKAIRINGILPNFAPKKRALDRGIRATNGEIMLFTDADCTPPPSWARETVSFYDDDTAVVIGYSPYRFDHPIHPLLRGMLALEFFSVAAVAAGSSGLDIPLTAAGCNLSYRRDTYFSAGGFRSISHWISGDDDLFVLKVSHDKLGKISYGLSPRAFVPGAAPNSWRQFWHQRIRYSSKSRHYSLPMTSGLICFYLLSLGSLLGTLSLLFTTSTVGIVCAAAWFVKALAEFIFLRVAAIGFGEIHLLKYFIPTALLHPAYVGLFGILGLISPFQWKDKSFRKTQEITQDDYDA